MKRGKIKVSELAKKTTIVVRITGKKRFRFRLKVGKIIFRFGAWVIGTKINIEDNNEKGEKGQ